MCSFLFEYGCCGYCRIRMWNRIEKNEEKRIRIYPLSYHITIGYGYGYSYHVRIQIFPPLPAPTEAQSSTATWVHLPSFCQRRVVSLEVRVGMWKWLSEFFASVSVSAPNMDIRIRIRIRL